jgi:hypothetical protein
MIYLQWETIASPERDAASPAGDAVSPEGELLASPDTGAEFLLLNPIISPGDFKWEPTSAIIELGTGREYSSK